MDKELTDLAAKVGAVLLKHGLRVTTAESCTGGWIAKTLTDIGGSSAWFERGFVVYSNQAKQELLGVAETTLITHGAVSVEVVAEMAVGALQRSVSDWALAVSGVAGPDGGSEEKPVGTVCLAWAAPGIVETHRCKFAGDREAVRRQTVIMALHGLLQRLA